MGRIRHKAAVVLRFIDTVTQAPVSGSSLYIRNKQKSPIIWKEDGYVVIMEQPGVNSLDVSVSGGMFASVEFHMDIMREAPVQIQYIHLLPASGYPFTRQMVVIRGDGASEDLYAVRVADSGRYRLMENLTAGMDRIKLWGNERFSPGQLLLLNEGQRYEPVMLLADDEDNEYEYHIRGQIRGNWKKGKTKVYSAIRISPDDKGNFCIAYDRISKGGEKIQFLCGYDHLPEMGTGSTLGKVTNVPDGPADNTAADAPDGLAEGTTADASGGPTEGTSADASGYPAGGTVICAEVEIQEGQEIEIHVGG